MQQFMTLDNSSLEKIAGGENGGLWSIIGFGLDSPHEACLLVVCLYLRGVQ